ncbi:putative acylesterase/phospholipase RssA [Bradyrhizobium sp. LM6.10]
MHEASFRSLMLIGGFSPAGSSVAFGPTLRSGQFDPFDLDPLRQALSRDINFSALRDARCPKLLIAATRIRDGQQQIFRNDAITADVALASTCPPLVHCAVEIDGEAYWDGGLGGNPPLLRLVQDTTSSEILLVQVHAGARQLRADHARRDRPPARPDRGQCRPQCRDRGNRMDAIARGVFAAALQDRRRRFRRRAGAALMHRSRPRLHSRAAPERARGRGALARARRDRRGGQTRSSRT